MAFWGDYHTHTVYSHGKGTIEENVIRAVRLGFKEIAITDHGFKHFTYNVRRMDWPVMQKEVALIRQKYPMIRIYLGLETNLTSVTGTADIVDEDVKALDLIICGYHKFVRPDRLYDVCTFFLPNLFAKSTDKQKPKRIRKNTDAYIHLLERYDIDIISHPNYGIQSDVFEVARACKHYGTFMELNGKKVSMTDRELERLTAEGTSFIVDSDAHSVERIGDFSVPLKVVDRLGIPYDRLVNWEKIPDFRSQKKKRDHADG
ncbi:MAG: PHP domain-containing protein [Clostridiales bacterium]|jgi:putative hydrolase|nr:PHP domain-containing protein [Clostridiales bacterium]